MPEENETTGQSEEKKEKGSGNSLVPIIIVMLAGSFLSSYLTANFIVKKIPSKKNVNIGKHENIHITYYKLGDFIVNLANKEANRYLKTNITLGVVLDDKKGGGHGGSEEIIKEKEAVLRDVIIEKLSSYTSQQLHTAEGRRKLKKDILAGLKELDLEFKVKKIFFNSFMMQ